ncbi:MAG: MurR/RpiR family transcriptional regulator [Clostridia bacterium]|nr:MurR/RpiR family transcriptional regulator [Clostridia bacterium]
MKVNDQSTKKILDKVKNDKDTTNNSNEIAEYILNHYKKISYMNLSEIVTDMAVDEKNIHDFVKKLGYLDYNDFRENLRTAITGDLKTTDRFKISVEISPKINNILNRVIEMEKKNIENLSKRYDEKKFMNLVEEVYNAPEIIVVGTRTSSSLAIYTEYIFNRIGVKARKMISGCTENFDFLSNTNRNALVLAFGFARYPKETIKVLNFFKKRNFNIIGITDSDLSPLVPLSNQHLIISSESFSLTDFFAAPMCLINTLVISISQLNEEYTLKRLNEFEDVAKDMDFYF